MYPPGPGHLRRRQAVREPYRPVHRTRNPGHRSCTERRAPSRWPSSPTRRSSAGPVPDLALDLVEAAVAQAMTYNESRAAGGWGQRRATTLAIHEAASTRTCWIGPAALGSPPSRLWHSPTCCEPPRAAVLARSAGRWHVGLEVDHFGEREIQRCADRLDGAERWTPTTSQQVAQRSWIDVCVASQLALGPPAEYSFALDQSSVDGPRYDPGPSATPRWIWSEVHRMSPHSGASRSSECEIA